MLDRTVLEVCRKDYHNPFCQRMMERLVFFLATKAHCISYTVADYEAVVKEGMASIIKRAQEKEASETDPGKRDFYQAVKMVLEGVITYAHKLSQEAASLAGSETDPARKQELLTIADACQRVPAQRATTFQEGLQAIWITHVVLHQENNNISLSLGRLDQVLYPLYRQGIEEDTLTPGRAVELAGCFFLKLADHVPMSPETAEELFT